MTDSLIKNPHAVHQVKMELEKFKKLAVKLTNIFPEMEMLILFGSRAKNTIHSNSDWDFAVFYNSDYWEKSRKNKDWKWLDFPVILADIFKLDRNKIDVIELNRVSPAFADRIALEGKVIYEKEKGLFTKYKAKYLLTQEERKASLIKLKDEIDTFLEEFGLIL